MGDESLPSCNKTTLAYRGDEEGGQGGRQGDGEGYRQSVVPKTLHKRHRREKMADLPIQPAPGGIGAPTGGSVGARAAAHRPGMVTFAAVMMFLVAGFEALSALLAFAGTGWWVTDAGNLVYANFYPLGHPRYDHRAHRAVCRHRPT